MKPIIVIGMGMSCNDLTKTHLECIAAADVLIGGKRHLDDFRNHPAEKIPVTGDLSTLIRRIEEKRNGRNIVVLASGDPLYYGIGSLLLSHFPPDDLAFYPNINSVSAAFSKIKEPWQDIPVVSLHGFRDESAFFAKIQGCEAAAVFTDKHHNPAWLSRMLLDYGIDDFSICVLERLGTENEKIRWLDLESASTTAFSEPNIVILKRAAKNKKEPSIGLGMPDDAFWHEKGMITKSEVRVVGIAKLELKSGLTMWDIGAGCGSVSIEASKFVLPAMIYAVEKNEKRICHIRRNLEKFNAWNVKPVHGDILSVMETLPAPDRVFIGGGGKEITPILHRIYEKMNPHGVIVVNTVLIDSFHETVKFFIDAGLKTETLQIQINRTKPMPWSHRFEALNPVWIVKGYH